MNKLMLFVIVVICLICFSDERVKSKKEKKVRNKVKLKLHIDKTGALTLETSNKIHKLNNTRLN